MLYDLNPLEKTKFSSYHLTNIVNIWQDHLKKKEKVDEEHLSWHPFQIHFEEKNLGEMYYLKKENQYFSFKQGNVT